MSLLDLAAIRNSGLEGTFGRYEIPGLLVRAARSRLSGTLMLDAGESMRFTLGFASGRLVLGGSSEPAERLGCRMVENGQLSFADEGRADELVAAKSMLFGEALVSLGLISVEALERTLIWHGNWLVQRVLALATARAQVEMGGRVPEVAPPVPLLRGIEDGLRQYDPGELEALRTQLAGWRFQAPADVEDAVQGLGGSPGLMDLSRRLGGVSRTFTQVAALAEGDDLPALTFLLAGLATAHPRIRESAGDRAAPASPLPIPLSAAPAAASPLVEYAAQPTPARVAPHEPPPSALEVAQTVRFDTVRAHALIDPDEDEPTAVPRVRRSSAFLAVGVALLLGGGVGYALAPGVAPAGKAEAGDPTPAAPPPAAAVPMPEPEPTPATPREDAREQAAREEAVRHLEAGNLLLQKKQVRKAIAKYREALTLSPSEARVHRSLGIAYTMAGDAEAAVRAYKAYLALAPDAPDAAAIREMVSQYEKAP